MSTQILDDKFVGETLSIDFDMLSRLVVGESVTTSVVVVSVFSGIDSNPAVMISGVPSVSNNIVSQKIVGGLPGVIYKIACSARTTLNNIVINEAKLAVISSNAATPP